MRVFPESSLINAFNGMNFTEPGACSCLYLAAVIARPFKVCGVLRIVLFSLINLLLHLYDPSEGLESYWLRPVEDFLHMLIAPTDDLVGFIFLFFMKTGYFSGPISPLPWLVLQ